MPVGLAAAACVAQPSGEPRDVASTEPGGATPRPTIQCADASEQTVGLLVVDGECPIAVEASGASQLVLRPLAPNQEPLAEGRAPEVCGPTLERCAVEGVVSPLGPVAVLSLRGHESEMPEQVYVGWIVDGTLGFAATWVGLSSVVDHTRVGPVYALAPHDCDGSLELRPTLRLPESGDESVPVELDALAGVWTLDDAGELEPPSEAGASASSAASDCTPLLSALP